MPALIILLLTAAAIGVGAAIGSFAIMINGIFAIPIGWIAGTIITPAHGRYKGL
ncbi:MAG: hypothetical protein ACU843_12825 [Gammaproteobacteria bacterium]